MLPKRPIPWTQYRQENNRQKAALAHRHQVRHNPWGYAKFVNDFIIAGIDFPERQLSSIADQLNELSQDIFQN